MIAIFHIYHHITNIIIALVELEERVPLVCCLVVLKRVHGSMTQCCIVAAVLACGFPQFVDTCYHL